MRLAPSSNGGVLPTWLIVVGSAAILFHLAAVIVPILDSPSGPWPTPTGRTMDDPPAFAHAVGGLADWHAQYLRLSHNYHFIFNRPGDAPAVKMEVRLRDDAGNLIRTLTFPDPQANPWVRHRQELLVRALAPDLPAPTPGQEFIAAPGQKPPTATVWLTPEDHIPDATAPDSSDATIQLRLAVIPQHLVPRSHEVMRPSDWSILLAHSYARYLCRENGAATAEIIRISREPVSPGVLFGNEPSPEAFEELVASFGEVSR